MWPGAAPLHAATNGSVAAVMLGDAEAGKGYVDVYDVAKTKKQTAKRIAESYAGNRRVVDRITVTGRGRNENPGKGNQGNVPPPQQ